MAWKFVVSSLGVRLFIYLLMLVLTSDDMLTPQGFCDVHFMPPVQLTSMDEGVHIRCLGSPPDPWRELVRIPVLTRPLLVRYVLLKFTFFYSTNFCCGCTDF
jgi:hypothetical protein